MRKADKNKEQLWKIDEFAQILGFDSVRSVHHLIEDGIIKPVQVVENGHRVNRFKLQNVTDYVKTLRDKAAGRATSDIEKNLKNQKLKAEIALKESQGELHKLKTEIAMGRYLSVEEIKLEYTKFFLQFKQFATALPARLTGRLAGAVAPVEARRLETDLLKEVESQLRSFVGLARCENKEIAPAQPEEKKTPEKKAPAKKTPAKTAKKTAAKATKKPAAKKTGAEEKPVTRTPAKKVTKATTKKPVVRETGAEKKPTTKAPVKKATKAAAKKAPAKKKA